MVRASLWMYDVTVLTSLVGLSQEEHELHRCGGGGNVFRDVLFYWNCGHLLAIIRHHQDKDTGIK